MAADYLEMAAGCCGSRRRCVLPGAWASDEWEIHAPAGARLLEYQQIRELVEC